MPFHQSGEVSFDLRAFKAGVPRGSVLGPILYLLFTADLPTSESLTTGTYANDTAILAAHSDQKITSIILQTNLNDISNWLKKWRIKANETKSVKFHKQIT
ncbi:Probable RNA-directed DNA polymerase from transposon BS [Eumeta japonica]|uniref:Probable RNA-directed DNA polymerase from transposon BS n=1 Tax=Eumeta variegata TaxID=151549 RepID=A0A4C1XRA2_EUMVA|nr:Probable RNA-directed DNA polymerase from transposon BS [Eumeta japonica]